jgi:serine phosphatase RsbU (regulator of sigma subunit)/anti-sigma regulatory factor (Ser/Thr protein kinase)
MEDLVERIAMLPYVIAATQSAKAGGDGVTVPWIASLLKSCPMPAVYGLYMTYDDKDWRDPSCEAWVDRKSWPGAAHLRYDFHDPSQDWYRGPRETGRLFVTQPYFDEGGSDIDMISITRPVYGAGGNFLGVAGVDVSLEEMRKIVRSIQIRNFGEDLTGDEGSVPSSAEQTPARRPESLRETAFLITAQGSLIVGPSVDGDARAPKPGGSATDRALSLRDELQSQGLSISLGGIRKILSSSGGWLRLKESNDKVVYWAQGRITGWKLVLVLPYRLIVAPARTMAIQSGIIGGAGLLILLGVIFVTTRRISGPINQLRQAAADLEQGDSTRAGERDGVLEQIARRPDELGRFAGSFRAMAREIRLREERLTEWNAGLEQTVRDRTSELASAMEKVERANRAMAADLADAAGYTRAVLPPPLTGPIRTDWVFEPSSQLGGDSFGYHWIDPDHLALYLLDVCGHGVGAALLSISVLNVIRSGSLPETDFRSPGSVMTRLNRAFPMERQNDMFFTAWYGVFEPSSGRLRFSCGGHPPALLIPRGAAEAVRLSAEGPVLGVFAEATFGESSVEVPKGSYLYLFSDGVYEIECSGQTGRGMMGYSDFADLLTHANGKVRPTAILSNIRALHGRRELDDDFSLLEVCFPDATRDPSPETSTISLSGDPKELARLQRFTADFATRHGIQPDRLSEIDVILEELVTNILKYGGCGPGQDACSITLEKSSNVLILRISDGGIAFNPLDHPEVDPSKPIGERPIGGLGIHFVKKLTDTRTYEYRDGKNILTLTKRL